MKREKTRQIFSKSCSVIPGGVNSPIRAFLDLKVHPLVLQKGQGDRIWDVDGNSWIDYCMSWGPLPMGHAHPHVVSAIQSQAERGSTFGTATPFEADLALCIKSCMPSMEKIRFVSSGTEATMSALRLARAASGKPAFIKFNGCYHGHADPFLVKAGSGLTALPGASSLGIPEESLAHTLTLPYNDSEAVQEAFALRKDIGCVIVEPIAGNMGLIPGSKAFLQTLREETKKAGALLIFDEVISGFRVGLGGAQEHYNIEPDLTCLGKIIGGGLPAAAFGGKACFMDLLAPLGGVYQAGTLSGNPLAMKAGLAALELLKEPGFYAHLKEKADFLLTPIERVLEQNPCNVHLSRLGSLFTFFFGATNPKSKEDLKKLSPEAFSAFFTHLFTQGIYISPAPFEACFLSSAHTQSSLLHTQEILLDFFQTLHLHDFSDSMIPQPVLL